MHDISYQKTTHYNAADSKLHTWHKLDVDLLFINFEITHHSTINQMRNAGGSSIEFRQSFNPKKHEDQGTHTRPSRRYGGDSGLTHMNTDYHIRHVTCSLTHIKSGQTEGITVFSVRVVGSHGTTRPWPDSRRGYLQMYIVGWLCSSDSQGVLKSLSKCVMFYRMCSDISLEYSSVKLLYETL